MFFFCIIFFLKLLYLNFILEIRRSYQFCPDRTLYIVGGANDTGILVIVGIGMGCDEDIAEEDIVVLATVEDFLRIFCSSFLK